MKKNEGSYSRRPGEGRMGGNLILNDLNNLRKGDFKNCFRQNVLKVIISVYLLNVDHLKLL